MVFLRKKKTKKKTHLRQFARPHNSELTLRIRFKFFTMKRTNRYMKAVLNDLFTALFAQDNWAILIAKTTYSHSSGFI